jgi:hypothetical protein
MRRYSQTLEERRQALQKEFNTAWMIEEEMEKIIEAIKRTRLWNFPDGAISIYTYSYSKQLHVYVRDFPYEAVVEHLAGPIHRKFDINWSLETRPHAFRLYTKIGRIVH